MSRAHPAPTTPRTPHPTEAMLDSRSISSARGGQSVEALAAQAAERNAERVAVTCRLTERHYTLARDAVGRTPWSPVDQSATRGEWAELLDQLGMVASFGLKRDRAMAERLAERLRADLRG